MFVEVIFILTKLKELRKSLGISQKTLAEAIGVSQQSINKYENHNIEPDITTLMRIAKYFNTSVDYIIGNSNENSVPLLNITDEESKIICIYRTLDNRKKNSILEILNIYSSNK